MEGAYHPADEIAKLATLTLTFQECDPVRLYLLVSVTKSKSDSIHMILLGTKKKVGIAKDLQGTRIFPLICSPPPDP
jgi:D-alanyl-D-alanine carboxypeptidase